MLGVFGGAPCFRSLAREGRKRFCTGMQQSPDSRRDKKPAFKAQQILGHYRIPIIKMVFSVDVLSSQSHCFFYKASTLPGCTGRLAASFQAVGVSKASSNAFSSFTSFLPAFECIWTSAGGRSHEKYLGVTVTAARRRMVPTYSTIAHQMIRSLPSRDGLSSLTIWYEIRLIRSLPA